MAETVNEPVAGLRPDSAARTGVVVSTAYLALASALAWLSLGAVAFPGFFPGVFSYGRLRPMTLAAAFLGFLTISLVAGIYYVLPRLTGTPLWREDLARMGILGTAALTIAGLVAIILGLGVGGDPLAFPWWLDVPILGTLLIPLAVTTQTIRARQEPGIYPTLLFVMAGVLSLPAVYVVGNLIKLTAWARALGNAHLLGGWVHLFVMTVGIGLIYYAVPKATDQPLASRQLAKVGAWTLVFVGFWASAGRLVYGPGPDWLDTVTATLGLGLIVAAFATIANLALTLRGTWDRFGDEPVVASALVGAIWLVAISCLTAVAGFRSVAALVGLTTYWEGVTYGSIFGLGACFVATWTYQALPNISGRSVFSKGLARRHRRLTIWATGGTTFLLCLAGLASGYAWAGGAFSGAIVATGDGFVQAARAGSGLIKLSVLTGFFAMLGQIALAINIARTMTSGRVTTGEVLVATEVADE